jgi:hypothetical protein
VGIVEYNWKSSRAIKVSDEQFKVDFEKYGTLELAKLYNVSKNTITDHRKRLGIPSKYKQGTKYVISGEVALFTTKSGIEFIVDAEDSQKISKYAWYISQQGYVMNDSIKKSTLLHRFIMKANNGFVVDHINHNTLDNRKSNLRVVTPTENSMNQVLSKRNKSSVKGVFWNETNQKWLAYITFKRKRIYLGYFEDLNDAEAARKEAEIKYFGEYAYKNIKSH